MFNANTSRKTRSNVAAVIALVLVAILASVPTVFAVLTG
jgi:hypothetical protein